MESVAVYAPSGGLSAVGETVVFTVRATNGGNVDIADAEILQDGKYRDSAWRMTNTRVQWKLVQHMYRLPYCSLRCL